MPDLKDIRKRITSVKNTQQITKAMKMVAAAKLRRNQEKLFSIRPYSDNTLKLIQRIMSRGGDVEHPFMDAREEKKVRVVLFTADRGLCGSFNTNLIKAGAQTSEKFTADKIEHTIDYIGKRGKDFFKTKKQYPSGKFIETYDGKEFNYKDLRNHNADLVRSFVSGEVDAVYMIYSEFKSVISHKIRTVKLLPMTVEEDSEYGVDYIYEPNRADVLEYLFSKAVYIRYLRALFENVTCEQASRMTAMDGATTNAGEMISNLTLLFNRLRQAAITKELLEIIGGAEALKA